jgi:DNA modification methylase
MNPLNQILQGDCITVMRSLASASVDFGLTDPPYLGSPDDLFKSAGCTQERDENNAPVRRRRCS